MSTLDHLKSLSDGQFHRLGDDLLRRMEPRYRRLRTHGLNDRGESIIGQPDSYVGETAATCSVAVCYTVQRAGWWRKVVEDVREAVAASPMVSEIVVVIPHNADRDGPSDKSIDWLSSAREIAGKASFEVIDGRDISSQLDTDHQDLRHEYLGIPYSRLSGPSILASCRHASLAVIDSIQISGRYDPERYAPRDADGELHRQWQAAFRPGSDGDRRTAAVRMIALVSDSGMGKTSLVCEFSRTLGKVLPVLLVQAGDLTFGTEDGLVAHVIQTAQGVLDQATRVIEEAALSKHLAGSMLLTVVLDGLDETHNPEVVRRAISFWLRSKLGRSSILIVTSRREFWKTCVDPSWKRWMPGTVSDDRSPVNISERRQDERLDPVDGFRLPDRFSEEELEAAWLRSGQPRHDLFDFPAEAREELRHPFTLRVFLDLRRQEWLPPRILTMTVLLERWLNHRLDTETMPRERITRLQFQEALRLVATRLTAANAGHVTVDELGGVPRFDPTHPPGPVVQRLIEANILESLPGQPDKLRFSVAAVYDFYQAEADFEEIKNNPGEMAERYSRLSFTTAYPRLARLGYRLVEEGVRDEFARRLADQDARMAAIVLRAAVAKYPPDIRARTVGGLGDQLSSRHRVRAAMAITLLGELNCQESIETLATRLLPTADIHAYLKLLGATAFTKLGYVPSAPFVYRHEQFGLRANNENYFSKETLAIIRGATPEFRTALADQALERLPNATGTQEHARAVTVLAYLGDGRLVEHLADRLARNGLLAYYENHALIALGVDEAGDLFSQSVQAVGKRLADLPNDVANNDDRNKFIGLVTFPVADVLYLITTTFEPHLKRLIEDGNPEVSWIASDLARRGFVPSLLYPVAIASAHQKELFDPHLGQQRRCVTADLWLGWWGRTADFQVRRKLIGLLPPYPNVEVEGILMDCLDSPDLRDLAARGLGEYGTARSAVLLRRILAEEPTEDGRRGKAAAAQALGDLRDEAAVLDLEKVATEHEDDWAARQAVASLGLIGNLDAVRALERLLGKQRREENEEKILEGLLLCGTEQAVAIVISRARVRQDGTDWLCKRLSRLAMIRGWKRGEYYTHIQAAELVEYLDSNLSPGTPNQDRKLGEAFKQIDSPIVREWLRNWAGLRGSTQDQLVREDGQQRTISDIFYEELRDRGDEAAIDYTLDERADEQDDFFYIVVTADQLRSFSATAVAERLRLRLSMATIPSTVVRMLALLGRFGGKVDTGLVTPFQDHPDDFVANVACETVLRLSDPLLVPDRWQEL
jgi:HEAT repeat protein